MTSPQADWPLTRTSFASFDGEDISYIEAGPLSGTPVLLVHGFVSDAAINWVKGGTVDALTANGFRVVAPDLRGHGASAKPHEDTAYPNDVLAKDQEALLSYLSIERYHLAGYSLGAITAGRMVVRDAKPLSLILSGMGDGITRSDDRKALFVNALTGKADPAEPFTKMVTGFVRRTGGDAKALALVMQGRKAVHPRQLAEFDMPCLVLNGAHDNDNGAGDKLAAMIPAATSETVPGTHMDAIFKTEFAAAIAGFLGGFESRPVIDS